MGARGRSPVRSFQPGTQGLPGPWKRGPPPGLGLWSEKNSPGAPHEGWVAPRGSESCRGQPVGSPGWHSVQSPTSAEGQERTQRLGPKPDLCLKENVHDPRLGPEQGGRGPSAQDPEASPCHSLSCRAGPGQPGCHAVGRRAPGRPLRGRASVRLTRDMVGQWAQPGPPPATPHDTRAT